MKVRKLIYFSSISSYRIAKITHLSPRDVLKMRDYKGRIGNLKIKNGIKLANVYDALVVAPKLKAGLRPKLIKHEIDYLIYQSQITGYQISKVGGVPQQTISNLRHHRRNFMNLTLRESLKLINAYDWLIRKAPDKN